MSDESRALDPRVAKRLAPFGEPLLLLTCLWRGKDAGLVVSAGFAAVAGEGLAGETVQAPLSHAQAAPGDGANDIHLAFYGRPLVVSVAGPDERDRFLEVFRAARSQHVEAATGATQPPVLVVTTNDVPGHVITAVRGDVVGLTVRARNMFSNVGASFRTISGGEVAGYTRMLTEARHEARERMVDEARRLTQMRSSRCATTRPRSATS